MWITLKLKNKISFKSTLLGFGMLTVVDRITEKYSLSKCLWPFIQIDYWKSALVLLKNKIS